MIKNKIVLEFSNSLDAEGNFKKYFVSVDSIENEEISETLNSGTFVVSNVKKEDRLSKLDAYIFVRVYDLANPINYRLYVLDNFVENEINVYEHIFEYNISLMSETKLLEKFQVPNRAITHKVEDGEISKKTIYEYICEYMELYVPKIKFSSDGVNWHYKHIIDVPGVKKLNVTFNTGASLIQEDFNSGNIDILNAQEIYLKNDQFSAYSSLRFSLIAGAFRIENLTSFPITIPKGWKYRRNNLIVVLGNDVIISAGQIKTIHSGAISDIYGMIVDKNVPIRVGGNAINYGYKYEPRPLLIPLTNPHEFRTDTRIFNKFNVPSADLGLNTSTLRQVLTILMQQVGCIPVIRDHKLDFIDFNATPRLFGGDKGYLVNNTVTSIKRSLSSDSYANTLVNLSNQVLDSNNEIVCETIGFRDRSNMLLKQKENLYLETKFPIYKVNECILNMYVNAEVQDLHGAETIMRNYCDTSINLLPAHVVIVAERDTQIAGRIRFYIRSSCRLVGFTLTFKALDKNNDGSYSVVATKEQSYALFNENYDIMSSTEAAQENFVIFTGVSDYDAFVISGIMTCEFENEPGNTITLNFPVSIFKSDSSINMFFVKKTDITPLVVENSQRQLLSRDFTEMRADIRSADFATVDKLKKYVYGTVGYSIGSNRIEGFSSVYATGTATDLGWITEDFTYIENIVRSIALKTHNFTDAEKERIANYFCLDLMKQEVGQGSKARIEENLNAIFHTPTGTINYSSIFFDIKYQPLNSFYLTFTKNKDVDFPISQYDSNAGSLTDFDRLSIHEQEQVDRIGNVVINIAQRTTDYSDIQTFSDGGLLFKDDLNRDGQYSGEDEDVDYIVYKKTVSFGNYEYNATYVGSQHAILKNYFTSIRTKYRAFQYVDYNQSVLRKENDTIFVRIGEGYNDYYDGDDKAIFGNWAVHYKNSIKFLYGANTTSVEPIKYSCEQSLANVKEDRYKIINDVAVAFGWTYNEAWQYFYDNLVVDNPEDPEEVSPEEIIEHLSIGGIVKATEIAKQTTKNDLSLIANDNCFALIYEDPDNVSAGPYIDNNKFSTSYYLEDEDGNQTVKLGGVPQTWQEWEQDTYNEKHSVFFVSNIDFYPVNIVEAILSYSEGLKLARKQLANAAQVPIVGDDLVEPYRGNNMVLSIVDDNNSNYFTKTFYKDYAERLNHTVQFNYYTVSKNIAWTEHFIEGNGFINRGVKPNAIAICDDLELNKEFNQLGILVEIDPEVINDYIVVTTSSNNPRIVVYWNDLLRDGYITEDTTCIKLVHKEGNKWQDIIGFNRNGNNVSYFPVTLNDTRSDYVLSESNGLIYRRYKAHTGDMNRSVDAIYSNDIVEAQEPSGGLTPSGLSLQDMEEVIEYVEDEGE